MIKAVIFDMDGLLVDSEHIGLDVMADCGRKQGVEMTLEDIKKTLGSTYAFSIDLYSRLYPQMDPRQLFIDFENSMHELAEAGKIPLKKGAKEFAEYMKELLGDIEIDQEVLKFSVKKILSDEAKLKNYPFKVTEEELMGLV